MLEHVAAVRGLGRVHGLGALRKLAWLTLVLFRGWLALCGVPEPETSVRQWHQACPTLRVIEFLETEIWQREESCPEWQRRATTASTG
jgi:hypothetical protein